MGRLRLALVVVAGCQSTVTVALDGKPVDTTTPDTGPDVTDGARSGARLKLTYWAFADGTRSWNDFYDSQRKEECYINGPWSDGNYYCSPGGATVYYTNATCTAKVGLVYTASCPEPAPAYLAEYGYTGCKYGPQHLYLRGAKVSATSYYYKNSDGTCGGPVTATGYDFYSPGAEIPTSMLAKLTVNAPTGSGSLTQSFITSDDGLVFPWHVHDTSLGTDCNPEAYDETGASAVCVPMSAGYAYYLHDAACTVPLVEETKGCTPPQYAGYSPSNSCPSDPPKYFGMGSTVSASPIYYVSGTTCTSTTGSTTYDWYQTTGQVGVKTLTRAPDALASHRIQLIHETTGDGLRVRDYTLYDQQQGVECYPTTLPDGTTRCYPYGTYVDSFYKDSLCTQSVDVAYVYTGAANCGPPVVPKVASKFITPPAGSCAYSYEIHTVGAPYAGSLYIKGASTCTLYTPTGAKYYTVGPVLDPTTFASATIVTDQ